MNFQGKDGRSGDDVADGLREYLKRGLYEFRKQGRKKQVEIRIEKQRLSVEYLRGCGWIEKDLFEAKGNQA